MQIHKTIRDSTERERETERNMENMLIDAGHIQQWKSHETEPIDQALRGFWQGEQGGHFALVEPGASHPGGSELQNKQVICEAKLCCSITTVALPRPFSPSPPNRLPAREALAFKSCLAVTKTKECDKTKAGNSSKIPLLNSEKD